MTDLPSILKEVLDSSTVLSGWAVAIGGATVAVIIGTSHNRPDSWPLRLLYLLFLPGWAGLAYSIYLGNQLVGSYLATRFNPSSIDVISELINNLYADQRSYLLWSLAFFAIWLTGYTLAWIFLTKLRAGDKQ
ncbi:hypothetical protein [Pseudomonas sp. NUPR-001]|uniref:hypothetical protein n=1 Tax=Pseudomonas sp. NUPR-001 TaxID=3416058 RepID=UPI003F965CA3